MSTKNVLQPIDVNNTNMDRSPSGGQRARYIRYDAHEDDPFQSPPKEQRNSVKLEDLEDFGVSVFDYDSDSLDEACDARKRFNSTCSRDTSKSQQLGGDTPRQDTQNISIDEWDSSCSLKKADILANGVDYFSMLPDEVILHILHFLPKKYLTIVAAVCSRFQRLTKDESLWAHIDVSSRVLFPGALGQILSRQVVILRLAESQIKGPILIDLDCRAANENYQSRLMYLDMGAAHIEIRDLVLFFSKCQRLKNVYLERITLNSDVMTMLAQNTELEVLNLSMVEGLDVAGLTVLLTKCRKLRELNIGMTDLDGHSIKYVCSNLPTTIDRLNISCCDQLLNDTHVADLVKSCPGLRELDLSDCKGLTGEAIQYIIQLRKLNYLTLSISNLIPWRALFGLKKSESLLYLDVYLEVLSLSNSCYQFDQNELRKLQKELKSNVRINKFQYSTVAKPTV